MNAMTNNVDHYLWLEDVEGDEALAWVEQQNTGTLALFEAAPNFETYRDDALTILEADDKIAWGVHRGDHIYNFWQDADHVRGIWRRTDRASYSSDDPAWETVLDLDKLATDEDENWVWKGAVADRDANRALVSLSRGGKDAAVMREFDLVDCEFVDDGFVLEEAKSTAAWLDDDTLLVATDFGPGTMTDSGYPAVLKRWHRGSPLAEATSVYEADLSFVGVGVGVQNRPERTYAFVSVMPEFFTGQTLLLEPDGSLAAVEFPDDAQFHGFFNHQAIILLRSGWRGFDQGSLVSVDVASGSTASLYTPTDRSSIAQVALTRSTVVFSTLEDVVGSIYVASLVDPASTPAPIQTDEPWSIRRVDLDGLGSIDVVSASEAGDEVFVAYNDFLTPPSLLAFTATETALSESAPPETLSQQSSRFDVEGVSVVQHFATSLDGTSVPYFVVGPSQAVEHNAGGPNRTLLYGYGGFEIPMTPSYIATVGKLWLEKGGCFVMANIRGGGEYGPAWHQAALKTNRHKAYEDFEAVADDLIKRGLTTPDRLAIKGGSNGGLLVGAAFTRRPDLYAGVICAVPLLDMLRFHLLLAGASWVGEYGSPEVEAEFDYLASYSPFHQVEPEREYPTVFFVTSTRDDRVHPAHARKMVARMIDQGHDVHYYENTEGGHSASANLKQQARLTALEYVYLDRVLA